MLRVLSYSKELETEKLMKEKEQKLRDNFKGIDRAKTTKTLSIPRNSRQHSHQEAGHKWQAHQEERGPQTQILFLVQNVAYDNKFMTDYEVVKDQLPEEWHRVPTKPLHPKKIPVQTAQKKTTPSETRRTGQVAARMVSYGRQDRKVEQNKPQNVWARHQASQREDWEELHSPEGTEEGREEEAEGTDRQEVGDEGWETQLRLQARQPHHHRR